MDGTGIEVLSNGLATSYAVILEYAEIPPSGFAGFVPICDKRYSAQPKLAVDYKTEISCGSAGRKQHAQYKGFLKAARDNSYPTVTRVADDTEFK
jgi:hypothetical protein